MERMKQVRNNSKAEPSDGLDRLSRRGFLKLSAGAAGAVLLGACADDGDVKNIESHAIATSTTTESNQPTSPELTTVPPSSEQPTTSVSQETTSSIAESLQPLHESLIDQSELVDRKKVFDIRVLIAGQETPFIDLPVFACMLGEDSYLDVLNNKGVMLDVARKGINDDRFGNPNNIRQEQMALPGELGGVVLFAHRITEVSPDRDDNGGEDDGPEIPMFRDIDLVPVGSTLEITLLDGTNATYRAIGSTDGIGQLEGVDHAPNDLAYKVVLNTNPNNTTNYENSRKVMTQETDVREIIRLVACHPKGSKQDRIVVEFERA